MTAWYGTVAERLGIPQRTYAYWERADVALRAEQLASLAAVLGVSSDFLLGIQEPKRRGVGPAGKMRLLFDSASRLPRSQQQKVTALLEAFVAQHSNGHKQAA